MVDGEECLKIKPCSYQQVYGISNLELFQQPEVVAGSRKSRCHREQTPQLGRGKIPAFHSMNLNRITQNVAIEVRPDKTATATQIEGNILQLFLNRSPFVTLFAYTCPVNEYPTETPYCRQSWAMRQKCTRVS